jgi:hypothetical protein
MKIQKHLFPYLYEFHSLGDYDTKEGYKYFLKNGEKIRFEKKCLKEIMGIRFEFGDNKNIHILENGNK